jgi:hypothetical protein
MLVWSLVLLLNHVVRHDQQTGICCNQSCLLSIFMLDVILKHYSMLVVLRFSSPEVWWLFGNARDFLIWGWSFSTLLAFCCHTVLANGRLPQTRFALNSDLAHLLKDDVHTFNSMFPGWY